MKFKWKANKAILLMLLFVLMLVVAACGDEDATSEKEGESSSTGDSDIEEVTIGFTGPLSGAAAYYGENTLSGLEMASKEINEAGGFEVDGKQYKLNLVSLDDEYLPNESASNAKRLVQENGAKFVYAPHSGGIYAIQVFNEQDDFVVMAYSSEPGIVAQGNSKTIRIPPNFLGYLDRLSDYQLDRFGGRIAFLPTASEYGKDWAESLQPVWEEKGGEVVFNESIDFSKETDFYTIVTNALEKDPDVLFIGGPSEPTALVAKQARDLGFEGGFLLMGQAKMEEMATVFDGDWDFLEGTIGAAPLSMGDYPGTEEFVEKFREEHDRTPDMEAGLHYMSMYALVEAMKAAGSVDDTDAIMASMDEGFTNLPEHAQLEKIEGIGEDGGANHVIRIGYVEDGEVEIEILE